MFVGDGHTTAWVAGSTGYADFLYTGYAGFTLFLRMVRSVFFNTDYADLTDFADGAEWVRIRSICLIRTIRVQ